MLIARSIVASYTRPSALHQPTSPSRPTCAEERQKTVDVETCVAMLSVVLPDCPHLTAFQTFLKEQQDYKRLTLDQWQGFLRFCEETLPDMSNFDESQAWPLLMDNFVDWAKGQQKDTEMAS